MIITNKNNLPQPFVDAVSKEYQYKDKRYSVTALLNSEREIILKRRYNNNIESDVSDMIWAIFGTAVHGVLENSNKSENLLTEQYLSLPIKLSDGDEYTLSGLCDLFDTEQGEVIDYKVTSTFKALKKDFEDYKMQGLIYAYMISKIKFYKYISINYLNGKETYTLTTEPAKIQLAGTKCEEMFFKPKKATFYMILRDWQKSKAKFDKEYPQSQVQKVTFRFTKKDFDWIEKWLLDKFEKIKAAEQLSDEELPLCSDKDRWKNEDVYAVMKKGRKSALRLLNNEQEAQDYMKANGGDYIELRKGSDRKCEEYCSCCEFCPYWQKNYKNDNGGELPF